MNFQENKILYTNRIQLRCFKTEFRFKRNFLINQNYFYNNVKTSQAINNFITKKSSKEFKNYFNNTLKNLNKKNWDFFYQESFSLGNLLKFNIMDFDDKVYFF